MRRRKKSSVFEDLVDIVALMPWWLGVVLAVLSYFGLHYLATAEVPRVMRPNELGAVVYANLWKVLATFGQIVVPVCCLLGSAVSVIKRRQRIQLFSSVATGRSVDALGAMTWQEFEMLVGEAFRREGFSVVETGGGGADGGVDLILRKDGEKSLVQCKQWRAYKVSVTAVRELYGVMAAEGAAGGYMVTSGVFTDDAVEFAHGRNIDLIDGPRLFVMIRQARSTVGSEMSATAVGTAPMEAVPTCPRCGGSMVRRTARRGANAGSEFWGCSRFPSCTATRPSE